MKSALVLLVLAAAPVAPVRDPAPEAGPAAVGFTLPVFSPKGYRVLLLRGSSGRPVGKDRYDLTDMNLTLFTGDASNKIETIILAPNASFQTADNVASGTQGVRVIRDDMEMSGERWTYDKDRKTVLLEKSVRVVIHASLPDLLK